MNRYFRSSDLPIRRREAFVTRTSEERAAAAAVTIAICAEYVQRAVAAHARRKAAVEQPPEGVEPLAPPSSRVPLYSPR